MPSRPLLALLAIVTAAALQPSTARAVCTASELIGAVSQPGCPAGSGACTVTGNHAIEDGCTLDFGARPLTITGTWTIGSNAVTVRAQQITLTASAYLNGRGTTSGARGGFVRLETTGSGAAGQFIAALNSRIDVSGNSAGGDIVVRAGGDISLSGQTLANGITVSSSGGTIDMTTQGALTSGTSSRIEATGGNDSDGGGEIDLFAAGNLMLGANLLVGGYDGGFVELRADGAVDMRGVNASALTGADAGSGGCVDVLGAQGVTVRGTIQANGVSGSFMTGGCGGLICLDADAGDLVLAAGAGVTANGASPDGGGGQVLMMTRRHAVLNASVLARGPDSGETCGGDICLDAGLDATVATGVVLDASGGDAGGQVEAFAGRDMTINGQLLADGNRGGSLGGDIALRAGVAGSGALVVNSVLDVSTLASCPPATGCGVGGLNDVEGCQVTLGPNARLFAFGPEAGEQSVSAREQLTLQAGSHLDARGTGATAFPGRNRLLHPARLAPVVQGLVQPAPTVVPLTTCPTEGPTTPECAMPCPTCGNGVVEFPETCDPGLMPPLSCQSNGCSAFCQAEDCDDGRTCTGDSCFADFGCRHVPTPECTEPPTPTPTITPTPSVTATPSITLTPSVTLTPSLTPTASFTPTPPPPSATPTVSATASHSATASPTPTASVSPTASATATPSASPTASPSVTATAAATATASATPSASATPTQPATTTATATATPQATATATLASASCAGDCNGDGTVAVNELITGVNIALGNSPASACASFDRNGDGEVSINELIAAVNAALTGC